MPRNGEAEDDASELKRGVYWADRDFPGSKTIYAYDGRGDLVLAMSFPEQYTDSASIGFAWDFLNAHDPVASPKRPSLTVCAGGSKPPRASRRKTPGAQLTVIQ